MGIGNAASASRFLNLLAAYYSVSRTEGIPDAVLEAAEFYSVDPNVMWLWHLSPDFRGEPHGMPDRPSQMRDSNDPDEYYLLNVMRASCTTTSTIGSMRVLALECQQDRLRYREVQRRVLSHHGVLEYLPVEPYP